MKRIGVIALHYGKEYLAWAVGSLACAVDEIHVFYSPTPTYGQQDHALSCPDTEDELKREARRFLLDKPSGRNSPPSLTWHRVDGARSEEMHRSRMLEIARKRKAVTMTVVDADEVWDPGALRHALSAVEQANSAGRWLARFHNFWRSWHWTVADSFRPVRIVDLRHPLDKDAYLDENMQPLPVYHFGYAQTLSTMRYKLSCHGHKAEFKPGWYERVFAPWTPAGPHDDLHPCVNNLWTAERTNDATLRVVDALLSDHPHRCLEIIA